MATRTWDDRRHFTTWHDMLGDVMHRDTPQWKRERTSEAYEGEGWTLGLRFGDAVSLVRGITDWQEGREQIEATAREQAERFISKRPFIDYGFDVTGEYFDVPSVIEGRPEAWLRPEQSNQGAAALVRLVVDLGTSGGVPDAIMRSRMCAVAAAALTLEACGNPVELIGCSSSQEKDGGYLISYQVTRAGDPIDMTRLTALAHPAFFRRIVFRLIEQTPSPAVFARHSYGYGECPRMIPAEVLEEEFGTHVVYVPPCPLHERDIWTAEKLLEIVKQRAGMIGSDDYFSEEN